MSTLTAPAARHAVRIGHTTYVATPFPAPAACCSRGSRCFCATGRDVRAGAVQHAETAGHAVLFGEGRTVQEIEVTS